MSMRSYEANVARRAAAAVDAAAAARHCVSRVRARLQSKVLDSRSAPKRRRRNYGFCPGEGESDYEGPEEQEEDYDIVDSEEEDARPANGRFSNELKDEDDLACVPLPIDANISQGRKDELHAKANHRVAMRDRSGQLRRVMDQVELMERDEEGKGEAQPVDDPDAEFEAMMDKLEGVVEAELERERESQRIHTRRGLACDPLRDQRNSKGDRILDDIRKCLNSFGYTRSQFQQVRDTCTNTPAFHVCCISTPDQHFRVYACDSSAHLTPSRLYGYARHPSQHRESPPRSAVRMQGIPSREPRTGFVQTVHWSAWHVRMTCTCDDRTCNGSQPCH